MKLIWTHLSLFIFLITHIQCQTNLNDNTTEAVTTQTNHSYPPFTVVELYTSEGCSSCPPADLLLQKIINQHENKNVFALSFHVDYWNYLGWKDPFSQKKFTERQRKYAQTLQLRSIYTPQMIINGNIEFVGSRKTEAYSHIISSLKNKAAQKLTLIVSEKSENEIKIQYSVENDLSNQLLNLALVQRKVLIEVKSGENRGKSLEHENIVRSFKTQLINANKGVIILPLIEGVDDFDIIGYTQNKNTMKITSASKVLTDN